MTSTSDISRWETRVEVYQDRVEEILDIPDPTRRIRRKPRTKVWQVERLLDSGAYGEVRLEKSVSDGKLRAVKRIPIRGTDLSSNDEYKKELEALVEFSQPEVSF